MNKETVRTITMYRQFSTESHKLANTLHLSDSDAKHELLWEVLQHRLSGWTDSDIETAIHNNDTTMSFKFTYARRELLRRHYKQVNNANKAQHELAVTQQDSYSIIDMASGTRTQDDVEQALALLPQIFANGSTRNWVESVLRVGRDETMSRYNQNRRQFNQKLNRCCRYAKQHMEKTVGLMKSKTDEDQLKQLAAVTKWATLLDDENVVDGDIQAYINTHTSLINDIVDTPKIKRQGKLVADFAHADNNDKYELCNRMADRKAQLERYLTLR